MHTLFEECIIGGLNVRNRFIRSATHEGMADENGMMTQRLFNVYEELAKGGVGTIITGFAYIMKAGKAASGMMGIYEDSLIDQYRKLTEIVHGHGSKIVMQIVYCGSQSSFEKGEREVWGPSAVQDKSSGVVPKEMTKSDIDELVEAFAQASVRVKEAGFDGVQIHAAHGFLLSKFLTPYYNRRNDEYGNDIENRARVIYRVYRRIRELTGPDFPVWIKIHCDDMMPKGEGLTFQDSILVCARLAGMGIDAIEVSGGNSAYGDEVSPARPGIRNAEDESYFRQQASVIAEYVDTDVLLVGGNRSVAVMEEILGATKIAGFSMSRALLCEPDLVKKWERDTGYMPKCIYCNECWSGEGNVCIYNR